MRITATTKQIHRGKISFKINMIIVIRYVNIVRPTLVSGLTQSSNLARVTYYILTHCLYFYKKNTKFKLWKLSKRNNSWVYI